MCMQQYQINKRKIDELSKGETLQRLKKDRKDTWSGPPPPAKQP